MIQPTNSSINSINNSEDVSPRPPSSLSDNDIVHNAEESIIRAPVSRFRSTLPQVLATMAQSLLLLALGMMISSPTVVIAALLNTTTETFSINSTQASWFAGILLICQPIGSILSGVLQEGLGRKKCMLAVNVPQLIGWCLIFTSQDVKTLYVAAVLMGFSVGFMEAPTLSYVGEISQPHLRGTLASLTGTYISLGYFLMYLLGTVTKWRTAAAICCAVPVITFLAILLIPESPIWLISKQKMKEAEKALCWLRGWVSPEYVATELAALVQYCEASKARAPTKQRNNEYTPVESNRGAHKQESKLVATFRDLTRYEMLRPLRLVVGYFFFYHCASLSGLRPYMVVVFNSLSLPISAHIMTVITALLQITGGFGCMLLVHRAGKRVLSLVSMTICTIFCFLLGIYTYQLQYSYIVQPWIPLAFFCCLYFFTNIGISPLPWTLLAEVFPARGRGIGGGISAAMFYVEFFAVSKTFLDLKNILQLHGVFFFYGCLGFVGILFIYFCLPETEGKKLEEVEKMFARNNSDTESIT